MSTMLITFNGTRENGNFAGDQLCSLKAAYLFVQNQPDVTRVIMSMSPGNEMNFLWSNFITDPCGDGSIPPVELIYDEWNAGDWTSRHNAWNKWRSDRSIEGIPIDYYRELYLRIHGAQRQSLLCGHERGLGRRNIYEYWYYGQENLPEDNSCVGSDIYDVEIEHPTLTKERDVYISPHCKTQGNFTFTFDYWRDVITRLLDAGLSVTVGYDNSAGSLYDDHLLANPLYKRHWGDHKRWMQQICNHKLVACGNTGTGWLAAACGVPMITVEPHNSVMADHRYRECGLQNIVEVIDGFKLDEFNNDMRCVAAYTAQRIIEEVRSVIVMTTGCYDILHAGHVRHLERARALGTKLIVALNSDSSVFSLKGLGRPINPVLQRKVVLEALRCVDEVRIFDELDATNLISEIKPHVLACGFGYTTDRIVGKNLVESWGGKVVVTCTGDATYEPSTTKIANKMLRSIDIVEICRFASGYSVNPFDKLRLMADEFVKVKDLVGDVVDLGCYRGGTSLVLRRLAPDKQLHLYDTWNGNPFDDDLCHHKKDEWKASLEDCQQLVGNSDLVYYFKGVFPESVPDYISEAHNKFCFVYVDMDTYQSTLDAIRFFWPRMVSGGKMVFDDYRWHACAGVEKAVDESFTNFAECDVRVIESQHMCIVSKI